MRRIRQVWRLAAMLTVGVMLCGAAALGQVPERPEPPPDETNFVSYVIFLILLTVVLTAFFKSAKRTHQD